MPHSDQNWQRPKPSNNRTKTHLLEGPVGVWQLTDEDENANDPFLDVELVSVAAAMCCLTSKHSYRLAVNSSIPVFVPPNCPVVVGGNKCTVYAGPGCKLSKKSPSPINDGVSKMDIPNTNILVVSVESRHRIQVHFKDNCTIFAAGGNKIKVKGDDCIVHMISSL